MVSEAFHFKRFRVSQSGAAHPVGTDGVLLGAWADIHGCTNVLDIGTGTGIIALMIAQRTQDAYITGIDIHKPSLNCSGNNFRASPWSDRLQLLETSLQDMAAASETRYDLIVTNPPFFSEKILSPDSERSLGRHTATLSQDELLFSVSVLLAPEGRFCVILPVREGILLREKAVLNRLYCNIEVSIFTGPSKPAERLMMQFSRDPGRFLRQTLSLKDETGNKSPEYKQLTDEFYTT